MSQKKQNPTQGFKKRDKKTEEAIQAVLDELERQRKEKELEEEHRTHAKINCEEKALVSDP